MGRILVVACAALARELRSVVGPEAEDVDVELLPAPLHNRPERIPDEVRAAIERRADRHYDRIVLGYADCGTGGRLDALGLPRLPGAHCYEFFSGGSTFADLQAVEPGTFYLTDYLARHFDALVIGALGLDRHPELRDTYFGNYRRLCLLSQSEDPAVVDAGRRAADRLGLEFVHHHTGLRPFVTEVRVLVAGR